MNFKGKVLVADDDNDMRVLVKTSLELNGFEVVTANDGQQAVEYARDQEIKVIIMDGLMPYLNGFEASKRIKEFINPNVKIILFTAVFTQSRFDLEKEKWGIDRLLKKPYFATKMAEEIHHLFGTVH